MENVKEIDRRIDYLQQIIQKKIPLKQGQLSWLSKPCSVSENIKNIVKRKELI